MRLDEFDPPLDTTDALLTIPLVLRLEIVTRA
jgi:hypothetical protein